MLLRRVISHVRKQEWTAIGIDFVIVVVGVFVGIQVSNWNDARLREETSRIYVERIRDDLQANKDDLNQRLLYFGQVRTSALRVLEAIDQPKEKLGEQFLVDVYQTSQMMLREVGRDTYDEILSVGANNAISDTAIRRRLSNFYRSIKAQMRVLAIIPPYRDIIRGNLPYAVTNAIRSACGDIVGTGEAGEPLIALPETCDPEIASSEMSEAVDVVMELDIRVALTRRITNLDQKLIALELTIDRIVLLEDDLKSIHQ